MTKVCPHCGVEKSAAEYFRNPSRTDGLWGRCKVCEKARRSTPEARAIHNAANRAWDRRHPERRRELTRSWANRNPGRMSALIGKWRRANLDKATAWAKVERAIRAGRLVRQPCEVCGNKAHAHHEDYTKPLDVRWLCPLHHKAAHMAEAR